jgi:DNA polymerase-3 subunit delta'
MPDPLGAVRSALEQLCAHPGQTLPQTLLVEGGTENSRLAAALYWAGLLNCLAQRDISLPQFIHNAKPCWTCPACARLLNGSHRDFFLLDGRTASIKIGQVREIRKIVGDPPREQGRRVVVMAEAQHLTVEAANALLKSLEEPCPGTVFVLTAPQRERLLATLVSRSWVLTLPWPRNSEGALNDPDNLVWGEALTSFLRTGQGWFSRTGAKGAMDAVRLRGLIVYCRAALAASLILRAKKAAPNADNERSFVPHPAAGLPLANLLAQSLDLEGSCRLSQALDSCEEALEFTVNPAILADWLASCLFIWLEEIRRRSA